MNMTINVRIIIMNKADDECKDQNERDLPVIEEIHTMSNCTMTLK